MSKRLLLLLIVLLLASSTQMSLAQGIQEQIYSAEDESFSFLYPAIYDLQILDSGVVELSGNMFSTLIYSPNTLAAQGFDAATPQDIIGQMTETMPGIQPGQTTDIEIGNNTALKFTYQSTDNKAGALIVIVLPYGALAVMHTHWDSSNVDTGTDHVLNQVAGTMLNVSRDENPLPTPTPRPTTTPDLNSEPAPPMSLTSDMADWQAVVAELESSGAIPSGGQLVFQEDYAFFSGQGFWYTPLAQYTSHDDVIMAGTLTFEHSDPSQRDMCSLMARIYTEGNEAQKSFQIGLGSDSRIYIFDDSQPDSLPLDFFYLDRTVNLRVPQSILFILKGNNIVLYINGSRYSEKTLTYSRSGSFGIGLISHIPDAQCTGNDIWAYAIPHVISGECHVEVTGSINQRQDPSTAAEISGQLATSDHPEVTGQTTGDDGFIWWQLEDDSWVRSDVVQVVGDCQSIPEVAAP